MKEEYVSYSQAVALYNLDFDWDCGMAYFDRPWNHEHRLVPFTIAAKEQRDYDGTDVYSAPTLGLAQKWMRDVKEIDVLVWVCACGYGWNISKAGDEQTRGTTLLEYDDNGEDENSGMWLTYESALSAGLDAGLELIKQK